MGAIAPVSGQDAEATPVLHTFNPVQVHPAVWLEDGDVSVPIIGQPRIDMSVQRAANGKSIHRASLSLRLPYLEVPAGGTVEGFEAADRLAYFDTVKVEFLYHERSTEQQRKNLRFVLANLLSAGTGTIAEGTDKLKEPW